MVPGPTTAQAAATYRRTALVAVVCGVAGAVSTVVAGRSPGTTVLVVALVALWAAAGWWLWQRAADHAARAADERAAEHDLVRTQAAAHAHSLWACLLHDEVAVALRAAATEGVSRLDVRRSARDALAAVDAHPTDPTDPDDLMPALRQAAAAGAVVQVDGPQVLPVPGPVAAAVLGAVIESLRNVERHAPGAAAAICVRHDDETVTITIDDDGPGFVMDAPASGGLRVSVADRMATIDGSAQVTSTPGQGTNVTLTWPFDPADEDLPAAQRGLGLSLLPVLVAAGALVGPVGAFVLGDRGTLVLAVVSMFVAAAATAWVARSVATTVVSHERGQLARVRREVADEVDTRRRARLEDLVVPFLHRLAGTTPLDEDLRAEAALAEQAVRDEMHLPEVLDTCTQGLVRAARADGCRVRLQSDAATAQAAQVNAVVAAALSVSPTPRELTVSVYAHDERDTVAVVAVPGSHACRDALHDAFSDHTAVLADDDDATWVEIRL